MNRSNSLIVAIALAVAACGNSEVDPQPVTGAPDSGIEGGAGHGGAHEDSGGSGAGAIGGSSGSAGAITCTNCRMDAPACDTTTGTCVGCLSDVDCVGLGVCNTEGRYCVQCRADSDCGDPEDSRCNVALGQCTNPCTTDSACGIKDRCEQSSGICIDCHTNEDCVGSSSKFCDTNTFTCVSCLVNSDCVDPSTPVCTVALGAVANYLSCAQCAVDSDCPEGKKCSGHRCSQCVVNADCPSDQTCDERGECKPRCASDADCPGRELGGHWFETKCNATTGVCRDCVTDDDCTQPFCLTDLGECGDCRSDADCASPKPSCSVFHTCI